jgi:hypothetical protein
LGLGREVARIELALERILQQARVSRDEPWVLHQQAITLRDRWVSWRREEACRAWEQRSSEMDAGNDEPVGEDLKDVFADFGIPELADHWNRVIEGLKWLTVHTRATL